MKFLNNSIRTYSPMLPRFTSLLFIPITILIASCSTVDNNRYAYQQDFTPSETPSVISQEPIPKTEARSSIGNPDTYTVLGKTYRVSPKPVGAKQRGIASWYGMKFHGHETSNGEIYDVYQFTAAHKTLPLPSYVRVTRVDTKESVVVRVNDRGPFHPGRIIDLSYAAAQKLNMDKRGTAPVEVEVLTQPSEDTLKWIQVSSLSSIESASALQQKLIAIFDTQWPVSVSSKTLSSGVRHRVRVGPIPTGQALDRAISTLADHNFQQYLLLAEHQL